MIKMIVPTWRKPGTDLNAFTEYWRTIHAKLAAEHKDAMGMRRYVQNHKIASADLDEFAKARGWATAPDGLTEAWWDSADSMAAAFSSPAGLKASAILEADEQRFCDASKISAFLAREFVVF